MAAGTGAPGVAPLSDQALVFGMTWTRAQAEQMGADAQVLLLIRDDQNVLRLAGAVPSDTAPGEDLRAAATGAAETGRPVIHPAGNGRLAVAFALDLDGIAAVGAAEIPGQPDADGPGALRLLQWGMGGVEAFLRRANPGNAEALETAETVAETRASTGLALFLRALETPGFRDAARAAATDLAQALGAERVAVTRLPRMPGRARLVGLSHAAEFARASAATDGLRAAADEALDQGEALIWPPSDDAPALARHALEQLARQSGAGSAVAMPMGDPEDPWGALVAEFATVDGAATAAPTLALGADALAPLLDLKRMEDRWLPRRIWDAGVNGFATLFGPRALGWKFAVLVVLALIVAAATVTAPARVTADAELSADDRVLISAPFDGILAERLARSGEEVTRGQPLLLLDDRDLQLEHLRDTAALSQTRIERDTAAAAGDRASFAVLTAEMAEIEARLALTQARLEAGRMAAPFDGVITGDATDGRIGAPVARGEELMSVAPRQIRSVTLFVPDARIDRVAVGQAGLVRLAANPDRPMTFEITRITPVTETRDGANTFRVRASLTGPVLPDLTHGMQGAAKITTGRDLWVMSWGKPFVEDLRLALWSFWP